MKVKKGLTKQEKILRLNWLLWELRGKWEFYKEEKKNDTDIIFEEIKEVLKQIKQLEVPIARSTHS